MNPRILGAFLVGGGLVAIALLGTRYGILNGSEPAPVAGVNVVTSAEPLRQYIPTTDSNNDGVPDWQELLNDSEPLEVSETFEEYVAPETLTDQFAVEFFEGYVRNKGFGSFAQEPDALVAQASDDLVAQVQDTLYNEQIINIIPNSRDAIRTHTNAVAQIMINHPLPAGTDNELVILERAVSTDNGTILAELNPIIAAYASVIVDMKKLPVPSSMVKEHLDLLNAYQAVHNDILGMQSSFADPMRALLRIQRYQDDVQGMLIAVTNLFEKGRATGTPLKPTDPVFSVFTFSS